MMFSGDAAPQLAEATPLVQDRDRILVVDDDTEQIEVLTVALKRQGFETLSASTVAEGLQLAREQNPQLIILDIRLPDGSGLDLCQVLCDDPRTNGIPVIILSGMERPDIIRSCRAAGCRYYVRKPYDPNALLVLAQNALSHPDCW
jgi:CheY-like chemotaxis protein